MNERIKQLANQAFIYSCEFARGPDYSPHNPYNGLIEKKRHDTKFAELIVRECCQWVNDNLGLLDEEARADLLKHFGVEE